MLESIEEAITQWKLDADLPQWVVNSPLVEVAFVLCVGLILYLFYKLARSTEVTDSGKIITKYHSPLTWPSRYFAMVASNRAKYTPKQKRFLSGMHRWQNRLQAFTFFLLGALVFSAGAFLVYMEPSSIFEKTTAIILLVGLLLLAAAWWLFTKVHSDDPFAQSDDEGM